MRKSLKNELIKIINKNELEALKDKFDNLKSNLNLIPGITLYDFVIEDLIESNKVAMDEIINLKKEINDLKENNM